MTLHRRGGARSRATIEDVARLAGVSIKTVSRVVNGEPNVRESTRSRVDRAIAELEYRPNLSARSLASQHSRLIALIYEDPSIYEAPSSGYVIRMQEGTLRACRQENYALLIHPCDYLRSDVGENLHALIAQTQPDGVVLAAPLSNMPGLVDAVAAAGTRLVCLSPGGSNDTGYSVATNDREVSASMTCYLASLGHRRIAFITGHPSHSAVADRYGGYRDGLRQSGLVHAAALVVPGDNSIRSGEETAARLLALEHPPTAIFAANDDMAAGVIRVAYRLGMNIPVDLSVAGFDDGALAHLVYPALTTVRQPLSRMAEEAALALMVRLGNGGPEPGRVTIPSELKIRESTGPAPV